MGGFAGTLGLASEWAISQVWARHPWQPDMIPQLWVAVAISFAGAVIGMSAGRVMAYRRTGIPTPVLVVAVVAFIGLLAVPFPRTAMPIAAHMTTSPAGDPRVNVDQYGQAGVIQMVNVQLKLDPPSAADNNDRFELVSWQGGSEHNTPFVRTGDGAFRSARPVLTGSTWKTLAVLSKGSDIQAMPVYMPGNADLGQAEIPVVETRDGSLETASRYLVRPREGSDPGPANLITQVFFGTVAFNAILFVLAFMAINRQTAGRGDQGDRGAQARPALAFG